MGTIWNIDPEAFCASREDLAEVTGEQVIAGMQRVGIEATALVPHPEHRSIESSVDCTKQQRNHHEDRGFWS